MQRVKVLNAAGPRASKDPEIYDDVFKIPEQAIQILRDEEGGSDQGQGGPVRELRGRDRRGVPGQGSGASDRDHFRSGDTDRIRVLAGGIDLILPGVGIKTEA